MSTLNAFPTSNLNAGLFAVGTAVVKLADLTNDTGVKLKDVIPASALTVHVRGVGIRSSLIVTSGETTWIMDPQSSVELTVADISTHAINAECEGVAVAVSYTRLMGDKA